MSKKLIGTIILVLGVLVLAYGGFTYTQETHSVDIGPVELTAKDKETVNLPVWLGVAGVAAGALLIASDRK